MRAASIPLSTRCSRAGLLFAFILPTRTGRPTARCASLPAGPDPCAASRRCSGCGEINDRVNGLLAYDTDAKLWHETDYWESPGEALSRGAADCEGFAIFKMYLAKEAGIPLEQTAILVGTLGSAREPHAVLGAKVGPNIVTLDNKSGAIVTLGSRSDFTPLYSIGVRGAYTYPLNWSSGSDVATSQASDQSTARVVTALAAGRG